MAVSPGLKMVGRAVGWTIDKVVLPVAMVIAGLFITVRYTTLLTDWLQRPSCSDPQNLALIPAGDIRVTASSTQPSPPDKDWSPASVLDGNTATPWVPADNALKGAWLDFRFSKPVNLQLICVVNGQASSDVAYENAGKIRSMTVTTQGSSGVDRTSPLTVPSVDAMQQRQSLNFDAGQTDFAHLRVDSIYNGLDAFDAQKGQWVHASPHVALSEIEFYSQP